MRRERRARRDCTGHRPVELAAKFFLYEHHEFIDPHLLEHVLEPRLGPVGAIAVIDEHPHHRIGYRRRIRGPDDDSGVAREAAVARKSAEAKTEPNAGLKPEAVVHMHRLKADVVGVLQHGNYSRAVEIRH